ncbi:MAG: hypothetical protein WC527_04715 [Candidatus Margulisiibacteriota bacterium]
MTLRQIHMPVLRSASAFCKKGPTGFFRPVHDLDRTLDRTVYPAVSSACMIVTGTDFYQDDSNGNSAVGLEMAPVIALDGRTIDQYNPLSVIPPETVGNAIFDRTIEDWYAKQELPQIRYNNILYPGLQLMITRPECYGIKIGLGDEFYDLIITAGERDSSSLRGFRRVSHLSAIAGACVLPMALGFGVLGMTSRIYPPYQFPDLSQSTELFMVTGLSVMEESVSKCLIALKAEVGRVDTVSLKLLSKRGLKQGEPSWLEFFFRNMSQDPAFSNLNTTFSVSEEKFEDYDRVILAEIADGD